MFAEAGRLSPAPGEVEIRVSASGLNFRDVLCALGVYPGAAETLGGECAGVVERVGEGVHSPKPGDEVMAFAPGGMTDWVTLPAAWTAPKPPELTPAEAAAMPVAYLTALYGLLHRARLKAGESVLIHAAAGGVGLAAVQIALRAGATVFATAGTPRKRRFLHDLGVEHVLDSRSTDFATEVVVDVVLNSLAGDFIPASVSALAPAGRFIELGKRGILTAEQFAELRPRGEYHPFDLGSEIARDSTLIARLWSELAELIASGVRPPRTTVFPFSHAPEAFGTMAGARHIGKLVLAHTHGARVTPDATYLITGGYGAVGLHIAEWLAARGAGQIVVAGRGSPPPKAAERLEQLRRAGANIREVRLDVSNAAAVHAMLDAIDAQGPPLRGVFHAAGVLDDRPLSEHSRRSFESVLAPKVSGTWNLHHATRHRSLDLFVLFSAAASLLGSVGQANYSAANAFLDAFTHYRRSLGLPSLAINWGAWGGDGMAAAVTDAHLTNVGLRRMPPRAAIQALELLLAEGATSAAVLALDSSRIAERVEELPLLSELTARAPAPQARTLRVQIDDAAPGQRRELCADYVREIVRHVLGIHTRSGFDDNQPLRDLGIDSLLAIELRNRLAGALGVSLPSTLAFDFPTTAAVSDYIATAVLGLPPAAARPDAARVRAAAAVAALSEEDAEAELLRELRGSNV